MKGRDDNKAGDDFNLDDPLGIAREPVPSGASDHLRNADDEATVRRRRARAGLDGNDDAPQRPGDGTADRDGASGIDMGYGGEGTNIKPSR